MQKQLTTYPYPTSTTQHNKKINDRGGTNNVPPLFESHILQSTINNQNQSNNTLRNSWQKPILTKRVTISSNNSTRSPSYTRHEIHNTHTRTTTGEFIIQPVVDTQKQNK